MRTSGNKLLNGVYDFTNNKQGVLRVVKQYHIFSSCRHVSRGINLSANIHRGIEVPAVKKQKHCNTRERDGVSYIPTFVKMNKPVPPKTQNDSCQIFFPSADAS